MLCTQAFVILLMSEILHEKFFKIIHFKKVNTKKEEEGGGEEEKGFSSESRTVLSKKMQLASLP